MRQLKDRFERLKRNKETEAKYYQLLEEFARLPVNHREIIEEVQAMTREIEDLEESAKKYLINSNSVITQSIIGIACTKIS